MREERIRVWAATVLAIVLAAGIVISAQLVAHHENRVYGDATASLANCPGTETVNCDLVNASSWSEIAGVPIAALAIPTYLLLVGLILSAGRSPEVLAYVFGIGILTVVYSAGLFVVSKTLIGFLCLWCMSLYAVNLSIPVLSALAARRSPAQLIAAAAADLRQRPRRLRRAAVAFTALLALTVGGDRLLRIHVRSVAARERERIERQGGPTVPAVPETPADKDSSSVSWLVPEARAAEPQPYKLAGPLRRLATGKDGMKSEPFDLQARLGHGKPVAHVFWAPGFGWSERTLVAMADRFAQELPAFEVYAVAGRRDDQKDEEIEESFAMLDVPASLPLLVDDGFVTSKALTTEDVPNVTVFSAKGQLVVAKIKSLDQLLITSGGNRAAGDVLRDVANGVEVAQVQRMFPYYPSSELIGRCAPAIQAKTFGTGAPFAYSGRTQGGRPSLVMFWSSTCKHCQVDVPQLVKWVKAHPGAVDVVGVTLIKKDQPGQPSHRAITEAYIRAQAIPWTIVEDVDGIASRAYESISTPTTFFVSPSGTVTDIWYYAHEEGFDAAMTRSLATTKAATDACTAPPARSRPRLAFSATGADGKRIELSSLLGQPTLVHFWATWCTPCVQELPGLLKFRETVEKAKTARVVLVSTEGEADGKRILEFQKKLGVDLRSYRAPKGGLADKVDVAYRLPRTFVLDAQGTVLEELQGSRDWTDPAVADVTRAWLEAAR
jgi:thiol-disulfide isomerase/thioredoxin/uncharacterized membrane protein